jgi:hypothetical protein
MSDGFRILVRLAMLAFQLASRWRVGLSLPHPPILALLGGAGFVAAAPVIGWLTVKRER